MVFSTARTAFVRQITAPTPLAPSALVLVPEVYFCQYVFFAYSNNDPDEAACRPYQPSALSPAPIDSRPPVR